ncbi:unnamed protein product, partial [Iphiclides podalirius]
MKNKHPDTELSRLHGETCFAGKHSTLTRHWAIFTKFQLRLRVLGDGLHHPIRAWFQVARERRARATPPPLALRARREQLAASGWPLRIPRCARSGRDSSHVARTDRSPYSPIARSVTFTTLGTGTLKH